MGAPRERQGCSLARAALALSTSPPVRRPSGATVARPVGLQPVTCECTSVQRGAARRPYAD
eukprot:6688369-Alexandrium_andersonii.AAC.1